jgi:hypothetical protein
MQSTAATDTETAALTGSEARFRLEGSAPDVPV